MSRYSPDHDAEPIYEAVDQWRQRCLMRDTSVLAADKMLWTPQLLQELDHRFIGNPDEGQGTFIEKLEAQLAAASPEACQLMAELLWVLQLFPSNTGPLKKREILRAVWSWSGDTLPADHPMLVDAVLGGIGSGGPGFNTHRWRELTLLIRAFEDLKRRSENERQQLLSNPWRFSVWLSGLPDAQGRQLRHMLPHLLFPDTFERISSQGDKDRILTAFDVAPKREIKNWSLEQIDRAFFALRQRLEGEHGAPIDFYREDLKAVWNPPKSPTVPEEINAEPITVEVPAAPDGPLNLILYGPPGTGKTYRLMQNYLPYYCDEDGPRFETVTFHQSYAYEDFVEGIRPTVASGAVTYEVRPGVLRRLCDRARQDPSRRYALLIDEINRGNVAKVFGELITLIEVDKRIRTDAQGERVAGCEGLEITLPYSGDRFGVPANLDVIATMNTADRSIALLDSALRRRFRFEELVPDPELLDEIDDGEGKGGTIDLGALLKALNDRLTHLLHRDRTIGHSYLMGVHTFEDLRRVLMQEILPLLQDAFYDDWSRIRLVLADQSAEDADFQIVRTRTADAARLFPGPDTAGIGEAQLFEIAPADEITPDAVRKIYEFAE